MVPEGAGIRIVYRTWKFESHVGAIILFHIFDEVCIIPGAGMWVIYIGLKSAQQGPVDLQLQRVARSTFPDSWNESSRRFLDT